MHKHDGVGCAHMPGAHWQLAAARRFCCGLKAVVVCCIHRTGVGMCWADSGSSSYWGSASYECMWVCLLVQGDPDRRVASCMDVCPGVAQHLGRATPLLRSWESSSK